MDTNNARTNWGDPSWMLETRTVQTVANAKPGMPRHGFAVQAGTLSQMSWPVTGVLSMQADLSEV